MGGVYVYWKRFVICLTFMLVACDKKPNQMTAPTLPGGISSVMIVQVFRLTASNDLRIEICGLVANGLVSQPATQPSAPSGQLQGDSLNGGKVILDDYSRGSLRQLETGYHDQVGTDRCANVPTTVFSRVALPGVDFGIRVKTFYNEIIQHKLDPVIVNPGNLRVSGRRLQGDMSSLPSR